MNLLIRNIQCAILLTLSSVARASNGEAFQWHEGDFRIGFESIELPQDEHMGLLGGSYLVDVGDRGYLGLGIYGALTGQRGGFFTGGLEGGWQYPLTKNLSADAGLFIGGGGGGSAPQGGGLMLRPFLGISWHFVSSSVGLQLSEVHFPNGDITSRQLALSISLPIENIFATGWLEADSFEWDEGLGGYDSRYSLVLQRYIPDAAIRKTAGVNSREEITLFGFEIETSMANGGFATLAAAGAADGGNDGYAEVLAGLGWSYDFSSRFSGKLQARLGMGGGGAIETGGGLISKLEAGVEWIPSKYTVLGIGAGRYEALDGNFAANIASVNLGYNFAEPDRSSLRRINFFSRHWQIEVNNVSYLLDGYQGRKTGSTTSGNVDLISVKVDSMLNKNLLLSGSASSAYDGGAGGYAAGLAGLGWQTSLSSLKSVWLRADAQMGVAGGGGMDVGGGLLLQSTVSIGWEFSEAVSLQLGWGRVNAPTGDLDAQIVTFGISVRTTTLRDN